MKTTNSREAHSPRKFMEHRGITGQQKAKRLEKSV